MPKAATRDTTIGRRALIASASALGLAGLIGMPEPSYAASPDAAVLAACAAFRRAHADQCAQSASDGWNDEALTEVSDRWYGALEMLLGLPIPRTTQGRQALTEVAWVALLDQASDGNGAGFEGNASREERIALRALSATMTGA